MELVSSVGDALSLAEFAGYSRVYGIGGRGIYKEMMAFADRIVITHVPDDVADADTFFPPMDSDTWRAKHLPGIGASFRPVCDVVEYTRISK
jgi:dihydrofolate reductase